MQPLSVAKLPVPTGDQLMAVVGKGPAACDQWAKRIAAWPPEAAVPQIVMNALDPALLELILGQAQSAVLIPLLRQHYADVRNRFPGPFADVEQVWRVQRSWWLQFAEAADGQASSGSAGLVEDSQRTDVLGTHPAGRLYLKGRAPRLPKREPSSASVVGASSAGGPDSASVAVVPAQPGDAPTAGHQGSLPARVPSTVDASASGAVSSSAAPKSQASEPSWAGSVGISLNVNTERRSSGELHAVPPRRRLPVVEVSRGCLTRPSGTFHSGMWISGNGWSPGASACSESRRSLGDRLHPRDPPRGSTPPCRSRSPPTVLYALPGPDRRQYHELEAERACTHDTTDPTN